jgi:cytoskeletal protein RodZ
MRIAISSSAMPVAEMLRHERECRGVTLEQLAEETKMPLDRLAAFEREGLVVNGGFYQRARIRAYARALHLDERVVMDQLEQDLMAAAPAPVPVPEPDRSLRRLPLLPVAMSIGCLIALAVVGGALLNREVKADQAGKSNPVTQHSPDAERPIRALQEERTSSDVSLVSVATAGTTETIAPSVVPAAMVTPTGTQLNITSQPEGARVTVDGIGWGVTPVTIRHLAEGAKRVRVTNDGYAAGERVVQVTADRASRVTFQLKALSVVEPVR